jgi:hypothetical protein
MNVPLIQMDPAEAREQLRDYRRALHNRADAEYEAVARGLSALADGTPILSLTQALAATGRSNDGRPRLAIARADRRQVMFEAYGMGWCGFFSGRVGEWGWRARGNWGATSDIRVPGPPLADGEHPKRGFSLVPIIPAQVRNAVRFQAHRVFILWEVERWADTPLRAEPDRDPYLLRHLHGDAYAVLAEWDLTPLEQLVMAGRRGN